MAWLSTALSLLTYPIAYLVSLGYGVLRLLVNVLIGLARYPLRLALFPFRVLAQFEAILIFITAAGCIGLVLGGLLFATTHFTVELLHQWVGLVVSKSPVRPNLDVLQPRILERPDHSRPVSGGRLTWDRKKDFEPWPPASTILEEDEESSSAYFED